MRRALGLLTAVMALLLVGCAKKAAYDYSAFNESKPRTILVLPPVSQSPDIKASHSVLSTATQPLAEAGFYVLPVAVVEETFLQNGLTEANDIRAVNPQKLHKIFGADAVLYLDVIQYGTSYKVIISDTRVTVTARLVDLRNGKKLWEGTATASDDGGNGGGGLVAMAINAAVSQIVNTVNDKSFEVGAKTNTLLLSAGRNDGLLYGPRSPQYANPR